MLARHITSLIQLSLTDFPAILLNGPRQVGKSTLARQLVKGKALDYYVTFDDLANLTAARTDPDGFLTQFKDNTVAIDEIQRVPDLLRALKKAIDENRKPGRFLLTGSANVLSYPGVTESLAGRMDIIPLEGLSISELYKQKYRATLIDDLFSDEKISALIAKWQKQRQRSPLLSRQQLIERIFYGGFPEISLKRQASFTERWFASYQTAYIERDVRDLSRTLDIVLFSKLLHLVGLRTANLLNIKNLGSDANIDQRTAHRYLEMLAITFQINQLHPWYVNSTKRLVKTPKVYLNDSGFACYLAGVRTPEDLIHHPMLGALAETWVWSELRKLLVYIPGIQTFFYRTHLGKEVDFILTKGQRTWGVEFKLAESITQKDFAGLKDMQDAMGDNTHGILLYTGNQVVPFGKDLIALPIESLLWEGST